MKAEGLGIKAVNVIVVGTTDVDVAIQYRCPFQTLQSFNGSTVREASRQASSTAFSSEPVEESP